jgi:hypothetical protein
MSSGQGGELYDDLARSLRADEELELDFSGVSVLVASFLNASIAKLYGEFAQEKIAGLLSFNGLSAAHAEVVQAVVDNAKRYYYDESYRKAQESALRKMFD